MPITVVLKWNQVIGSGYGDFLEHGTLYKVYTDHSQSLQKSLAIMFCLGHGGASLVITGVYTGMVPAIFMQNMSFLS